LSIEVLEAWVSEGGSKGPLGFWNLAFFHQSFCKKLFSKFRVVKM